MSSTRLKILELSAELTRKVGFNGFSYLDLAKEIGVKHAGIHYHFKTKDDLALALVDSIRERNGAIRVAFEQDLDDPKARLDAMVAYFASYPKDEKFCMCGMMAAELASFSPNVRQSLGLYFKEFRNWLAVQFSLLKHPDPQRAALQFISGLEGSLLIARLEGDAEVVDRAMSRTTTQHDITL